MENEFVGGCLGLILWCVLVAVVYLNFRDPLQHALESIFNDSINQAQSRLAEKQETSKSNNQ